MSVPFRIALPLFLPALLVGAAARAAEGFEPRYNLAGSLGGEIFAPPDQTGWAFGVAATHVHVDKVSGGDGGTLTMAVPGGTVPLPAPLPAALAPAYRAALAVVPAYGTLDRYDAALAYFTRDRYAGGRFLFIADLPLARKGQTIVPHADTPALAWDAQAPAALRGAVDSAFAGQYQDGLAAEGRAMSGHVKGIGDVELTAAWQRVGAAWRVLAGTTVVLPTGKYGADPGPDIGTGNYKTLRPGIQAAWLPTSRIAVAAKLSLGLNTRNRDNQLRSGNWAGLETAAGYMTPVGVIGVHAVRVQQYQDDDGNPLGPCRFRSTNAGMFFTTMVPGIGAALTLQSITTRSSQYAKAGSMTQARLIKAF
jgi:hypothetical protein